jgi:hypothetical protein
VLRQYGRLDEAERLYLRAQQCAEQLGGSVGASIVPWPALRAATIRFHRGDLAGARLAARDAVRVAEKAQEWHAQAFALALSGLVASLLGDQADADTQFAVGLRLVAAQPRSEARVNLHLLMGYAAAARGEPVTAAEHLRATLSIARQAQAWIYALWAAEAVGALLVPSDVRRGLRLLGAADERREGIGSARWPLERQLLDASLAEAARLIGAGAVAGALAQGRAMSLEAAVAEALDASDSIA